MMQLPDRNALLARVKGSRGGWDASFRPADLEPIGAGQESVWDYPRPPALVPAWGAVRVACGRHVIAESARALVVKETAGAPVPYLPPDDVNTGLLAANGGASVCEWKGAALAYDCVMPDGARIADAAWCYPEPFGDLPADFTRIAGWFAFYPAKLDCRVQSDDGTWEQARPQPGGFYGGWMLDRIAGPVKGGPGTGHW